MASAPRTRIRGECRDLIRGGLREDLRSGRRTIDAVVDRESRTQVQGVEVGERCALQAEQSEPDAHCRSPGIDGTQLRPDMEVDAPPPQRAIGAATGIDELRQLVGQDAELGPRGAHREAAMRLGVDLGIDAHHDIQADTGTLGREASTRASSADSRLNHSSGSPARAAATAARSSAMPLPIPSSAIPLAGNPAR